MCLGDRAVLYAVVPETHVHQAWFEELLLQLPDVWILHRHVSMYIGRVVCTQHQGCVSDEVFLAPQIYKENVPA